MRTALLGCAALLLACGGDDRGRRERTAQLAACVDAIERAGAGDDPVEVVARGCRPACAGLDGWLAARAALRIRPGVLATPAADATSPTASLADGCPPEPGASDDAAVLGAVARWLDRLARAGVADAQLPRRVEHVTERATFALAPPARPGLPPARFHASPRARQLVVIGPAAGELRVGALDHVRLRGGRLEQVAVPGAHPGQPVALDQIGVVFHTHGEALAQATGAPPPTPLVIADATTPVTALFDVVTQLGVPTAEVAVEAGGTRAHPVVLERKALHWGTPEVELAPDAITLRGFGDDRVTDWTGLPAELDHFAAVNAPVRSIELRAHPGATVAELVRLLDACVTARVSSVVFAPP